MIDVEGRGPYLGVDVLDGDVLNYMYDVNERCHMLFGRKIK